MNPDTHDGPPAEHKGALIGRELKKSAWPSIILALCLAIFMVKAVTSMVQESSTWDETCYFGLGKYLLQTQRWDVPGCILHPPLSYYIHSIPLLFFPTDQRPWQNGPSQIIDRQYLGRSAVGRGQALLASPQNHGDRLLNLARLMMVLTALLLGCFVYWWSYSLYGQGSAVLTAILFAFSPDILAHARLITPDIILTTFTFITVFYFWRLMREGRTADAVLGGICLGLALLSKYTALLLLPACLGLVIPWKIKKQKFHWRPLLIFALTGMGIFCLGYGMRPGPYFAGIAYQWENAHRSYRRFLMGQYSFNGWWYYYIVAFLIKTPLATLLFIGVAAAAFLVRMAKGDWINETFLLLPPAVIVCFFSLNKPGIGLRYILPAYPFLFVFASKAAQIFLSSRKLAALYGALVLWYGAASSFIHPHYLSYFNELVGGPDHGYEYLVDSNCDWGQDLKGLKEFMQATGIPKVNLSYFGSDSPERYGIAYNWLPSFTLRNPHPKNKITLKGWVAISVTDLEGVYFEDPAMFAWFRSRDPVAKIGYSIFIYKVD